MPVIIKRYPNRKLYNTETKRYITLEGIASLIQQGEAVQILDHNTGDDLTNLTLGQIIFEQEKKASGFLPQSLLTTLIQAGGETLGNLRRTLASPLEMFAQVDAEIERRIQDLVSKGELAREEGGRLLEKLLKYSELPRNRPAAPREHELERLLSRAGLPTREEVNQLLAQLDLLTARLDELTEAQLHKDTDHTSRQE